MAYCWVKTHSTNKIHTHLVANECHCTIINTVSVTKTGVFSTQPH